MHLYLLPFTFTFTKQTPVKHTQYWGMTQPQPNHNTAAPNVCDKRNPNQIITLRDPIAVKIYTFLGPCATFSPKFVKIGRVDFA